MERKHTKGEWEIVYNADFENKQYVDSIRVKEWSNNDLMGDYQGCIIADFTLSHGRRHHAYKEAEANAAHIIKCVNAHEDLVNALQAIVNDWSERMHGETEQLRPTREDRPAYWSPSSALVSSSVISNARKVLENIKP